MQDVINHFTENHGFEIIHESDCGNKIDLQKENSKTVLELVQDKDIISANSYYSTSYLQDHGWDNLVNFTIFSDLDEVLEKIEKELL